MQISIYLIKQSICSFKYRTSENLWHKKNQKKCPHVISNPMVIYFNFFTPFVTSVLKYMYCKVTIHILRSVNWKLPLKWHFHAWNILHLSLYTVYHFNGGIPLLIAWFIWNVRDDNWYFRGVNSIFWFTEWWKRYPKLSLKKTATT